MTIARPVPTRPAPARRRLAHGVHVVPRDAEHLQVGLDPPARVIVRSTPGAIATLDLLRRGRPLGPPTAEVAALLGALESAGLLEAVAPARDRAAPAPVGVVDLGLGLGQLTGLLRRSGVPEPTPERPAGLFVVGSPGPLPRPTLDDWLRDGVPHLVLAGTGRPGGLRLGPLVEPGVTACQRCVDAAESSLDPRRTLVLEQLATRPPAPVPPSLAALAVAWAAREAITYAGGGQPLTWSASIDLDEPVPIVRSWSRHPHCGCAWNDLA